MIDVSRTEERILAKRREVPTGEAMLVAISGIDGSGKGYVAGLLQTGLSARGVNAVAVNVDGWLSLPAQRFSDVHPAEHFYRNAIRFDAMFDQLILPLKRRRSLRVEFDFAEETAHAYQRRSQAFENVDVILLEGIYLMKREFRQLYDWSIWVDCSFETALERALARGQEGLPADETIQAYRTIYFPAQEIHFIRDDPRAAADDVLVNDPRLAQAAP